MITLDETMSYPFDKAYEKGFRYYVENRKHTDEDTAWLTEMVGKGAFGQYPTTHYGERWMRANKGIFFYEESEAILFCLYKPDRGPPSFFVGKRTK